MRQRTGDVSCFGLSHDCLLYDHENRQLSFARLVTPEMAQVDLLATSIRTAKCPSAMHRYSQLCSLVLFGYMKKEYEPTSDQESTQKSFLLFLLFIEKLFYYNFMSKYYFVLVHLALETLPFVVVKLQINLNRMIVPLLAFVSTLR